MERPVMIQKLFLLALMSAQYFHDVRSEYLLIRLNSQSEVEDPLNPETDSDSDSDSEVVGRQSTYVYYSYYVT